MRPLVIKLKIPAFPKEVDGKNLAAEYKKFAKAVAEIQKIVADCQKQVFGLSSPLGDMFTACYKKSKEKNLDPKQVKALEELTTAVQQIENKIGKNIIF